VSGIRVTVEDLATGETESKEFDDDVLVITAGTCWIDHVADYPTKGTQVYTIKGRLGRGVS
jgi:hypothetical protein